MNDWVSFLFYSGEALLLVFTAAYCLLICRFYKGWKKIKFTTSELASKRSVPDVSIIVCCRNEEKNLPALIHALKSQTDQNFELILVNDHSDDKTLQVMLESQPYFQSVKVLNAVKAGKKSSQRQGVFEASSDFIITTDADCLPASGWVETYKHFLAVSNSDLVIGPVKMFSGTRLFTQLQQLEFATLVASGMGAAGDEMPVLCNAANMCFRKSAWLESMHDLNEDILSGDDVFLLLSVKKRKGRIDVLKSVEAMVVTAYSKTLKGFIIQRRRWLSKLPAYRDFDLIAVGIIVGLTNFALIVSVITSFYNSSIFIWFLIAFLVKLLADALFLNLTLPFFGIKRRADHIVALSVLYPFYMLSAVFAAVIPKHTKW